jgi:tRNA(Ile)-lysidine synthase
MMLIERVGRFIRQHDLMRHDTRVVAALSGGSDSVALVSILQELHRRGALVLAGVAHFNHQLRATADRDEQLAVATAAGIGLPILVDRADVRARARTERRSLEDAARAARYEFFERARQHVQADVVALGHTRDDQAETFLLRLLRGAGPRGLAAMYPRHGRIVRPLLDCRREALRAWLAARRAEGHRAAAYIDDESNADVGIPRNRVRAELLPLLEARFNPAIVDTLAAEADIARETWDWLQAAAADAAAQIVRRADEAGAVHAIDLDALHRLPPALQRVVVWQTMTDVARGRAVGFDHAAAALRLGASDGPGTAIDAPGLRVERIGSRLVLTSRPPHAVGRWPPRSENRPNLFWYSLSIPGEVELPQANCVLTVQAVGGIDASAVTGNGPAAVVRADLCRGSLAVRNRRPGDRFSPVGLGGRKKLQDFFVDRKVARGERDGVPLVVDRSDRIVWVAGYGIDEAFRVTEPAQPVLLLRLKALGGPA